MDSFPGHVDSDGFFFYRVREHYAHVSWASQDYEKKSGADIMSENRFLNACKRVFFMNPTGEKLRGGGGCSPHPISGTPRFKKIVLFEIGLHKESQPGYVAVIDLINISTV